MADPEDGITVTFDNVSVDVYATGSRGLYDRFIRREEPSVKRVLQQVSGTLQNGSFTVVCGSSGAGKTTLLDYLGGRLQGVSGPSLASVTGSVEFNGETWSNKARALRCGYVRQFERFLPHLTVRETLRSGALLRMPWLTASELDLRVDAVIADLGLRNCVDTRIGDEHKRGISGGEQRRVSIGVQLLQDPGLDSFTAHTIVSLLAKLTASGLTILATIHQPRADFFPLFDQIILMARGMCMFSGPTNDFLPYLDDLGFRVPILMNPLDFAIDILNGAALRDDPQETEEERARRRQLQQHNMDKLAAQRNGHDADARIQDILRRKDIFAGDNDDAIADAVARESRITRRIELFLRAQRTASNTSDRISRARKTDARPAAHASAPAAASATPAGKARLSVSQSSPVSTPFAPPGARDGPVPLSLARNESWTGGQANMSSAMSVGSHDTAASSRSRSRAFQLNLGWDDRHESYRRMDRMSRASGSRMYLSEDDFEPESSSSSSDEDEPHYTPRHLETRRGVGRRTPLDQLMQADSVGGREEEDCLNRVVTIYEDPDRLDGDDSQIVISFQGKRFRLRDRVRSPWWISTKLLLFRIWTNAFRDQAGIIMRLTQLLLFGVLLVLFIPPLGTDQRSVQNRTGLLFEVASPPIIIGLLNAIALFPIYRDVYVQEMAERLYSPISFFVAASLAEFPFYVVASALFTVFTYYSCGLAAITSHMFMFMLMMFLQHYYGEALGLLFLMFIKDTTSSTNLATLVVSFTTLASSGFLRAVASMPALFRGLSYLAIQRFVAEVLVVNEFTTCWGSDCPLQLECPPDEPQCAYPDGNAYINAYYQGATDRFWMNVGLAAMHTILLRILVGCAFVWVARPFRSANK